ncbi:glycoside hydrolase family 3 protein [Maribellus maritimus]|uniref:glycoside hydrolase family 3 protein n=1 Tax=Maribellus maritimus TaxID=2870838 RepID=UPI001EEC0F39|nr:glycoside hydrolase family 3 N-terminal domain-containing protein [Maribellus maritimus]MCG6187260.1 glycoside hydrolase family 3 C-terminal domain-containing protein [Maribellus maritimus]
METHLKVYSKINFDELFIKKMNGVSILLLSLLFLLPSCNKKENFIQPELGIKDVERIESDGLQFKDLNKNGELDPYEDWRLSAEERAENLVSMMTLEEKAGLMHITSERRRGGFGRAAIPNGGRFPGQATGAGVPNGGASPGQVPQPDDENETEKIIAEDPFPATIDYINDRKIRYLIIRDNLPAYDIASRNNKYQEIAEQTRLGIPIVFTSNPRNHSGRIEFGITEASGQFSTWPGQLGLAAANDASLIRQFAEIARKEWRAAGIRKIYGYQVETATEPRWRRISGTFSESPELSAEYTRELVIGFQGDEINNESVVHTIKHFPGDGPVYLGMDPHTEQGQWAIYPTEGSLEKYHLPPFQAAIDAGVSSIMSYYNRPSNEMSVPQLNGEPFEDVAAAYNKAIITDLPKEMGFKGYINTDSGILTRQAFGVEDLSMEERYAKAVQAGVALFSDVNDPAPLLSAVNSGLLSEEDLNPKVTLLLTEIFKLGLFENPYVDPDEAQNVAENTESQAAADEAHRRSIVLLSNSDILPLENEKRVYVEVFTGRSSEETTKSFKELLGQSVQTVDNPSEADVAIVWAMPSTYEISPEEGVSIDLKEDTGIDVAKIRDIESKVPTILVINFDNPWIINQIEPGAAAVIGTFGVKAEALIDAVYGRYNPSGKLPFTIPANLDAVEKNASDVPGYAEDFDYVYTNKAGDDYAFGFGLSY